MYTKNTNQKLNPTRIAYIFLIVLVTIIIGLLCLIRVNRLNAQEKNTCECHKFKVYTEYTIYPDGTFDTRKDSICIISSVNGAITTKKLDNE